MADKPRHEKRKPPLRRIAIYTGITLILVGYAFLSIPPETGLDVATRRAFTGIGLVITGAALWLGNFFFPK
ncbi:MAG: hypothetical protein ACYDDT_07655 [Sulfuricella sp.]